MAIAASDGAARGAAAWLWIGMANVALVAAGKAIMLARVSVVCLGLGLAAVVSAEGDPRYQAVADLGELNGIALQCKYLDQVRSMKAAVVANAPKERSFGLAFDQATNDAFLAFIQNDDACPLHDDFERRVGHQIDRTAAAFR